jgi:hypothetical protein
VLAQLDSLRAKATREIPALEGMSASDHSNVATDNPPRDMPVTEHPPDDEVKDRLLATVEAELYRRDTLIRAECVAIHAAIVKALSLESLEGIVGTQLKN